MSSSSSGESFHFVASRPTSHAHTHTHTHAMRTHWQEEQRLPAEEEVKTPPRPNNKAPRANPECPPNVKLAHRGWKASHPRSRRSLHESLAKSSWAPTTPASNNAKRQKAAANRALYASVHRAKATSPLCDYLREILETSPLRDLTNASEAAAAASRTKFSVGVKRRLESLFNESDDDSFADRENNKSPRLS